MSPCRNVLDRGFTVCEIQHQQRVRCECSFNLEDENSLWAQDHFDQIIIKVSPYDVEKLAFSVRNMTDSGMTLRPWKVSIPVVSVCPLAV